MQDNLDSQVRNWAMLCHLASLVGFLLVLIGLPLPFSNLLGPLVVWLVKKNDHPFIDTHGKESLNFQISVTLYTLVATVVVTLGAIALGALGLIAIDQQTTSVGIFALMAVLGVWLLGLLVIIGVVSLCLTIYAAVKASNGEVYYYPFTLRFLR